MENEQISATVFPLEQKYTPAHDDIARRAYTIWEARGGGHGLAEQDWLEAERQLHDQWLQELQPFQTASQAA